MIKKRIYLLFSILIYNTLFSQEIDFEIYDINFNSKLKDNKFDSMEFYLGAESLMNNVFNVTPGEFIVYRFIRDFNSSVNKNSQCGGSKVELIVLTVKDGIILDVLLFPLSWREPPLKSMLYYNKPNVSFGNSVKINELGLKPMYPEINVPYTILDGVISIK